ncbi:MAG: MFS transporter [Bowdeniella nasicola]|nr:MFS transporter [Bowdeniella nasicola]
MPSASSPPARLWDGAFRWFYFGRIIDLTGSAMTPVVLTLAVLERTGSARHVGIVLAANVAATVAFILIGGVVGDRWARSRILVTTALVAGVMQLGMAAVVFGQEFHLPLMSLFAAATGLLGAFNTPALRGIVPELVLPANVQRANALLATGRHLARIGAPATAGILVVTIGGGWALVIDAITFLIAAACFTRLPHTGIAPKRTALVRELRAGWSTFISLRWIWVLTLCYFAVNLLLVGPWQVLGPLVVTQTYGATTWGVLLSLRGVAMVAASALVAVVRFSNPLIGGLLLGTLSALPLAALGVGATLPVLIAAVMVAAMGMSAAMITYDTCLQRYIPANKLSRVTSYDDAFAFAAVPLSQLAAGPLAEVIGIHRLLGMCALGIVAFQLLPLISPAVRQVSRQ